MTYIYRSANASDAIACAKIIREWGAETPWMVPLDDVEPMADSWRELLETDLAWVAEKSGCIVGFCVRQEDNITGLYVARAARSRGVGKSLLDLAKANRYWITVWAYEANTQARKFYRREGLVEICREIEKETNLKNVEHRWTRST